MEKRKFTEWLNYQPTKVDLKVKYFEYFVKKLVQESKDLEDFKSRNYSIVKTMKLLFFTVQASIEQDKENSLLNIFDNWYAAPYGHVEGDIDKYIKENDGKFSFFRITRFGIDLGYDFSHKSKP